MVSLNGWPNRLHTPNALLGRQLTTVCLKKKTEHTNIKMVHIIVYLLLDNSALKWVDQLKAINHKMEIG